MGWPPRTSSPFEVNSNGSPPLPAALIVLRTPRIARTISPPGIFLRKFHSESGARWPLAAVLAPRYSCDLRPCVTRFVAKDYGLAPSHQAKPRATTARTSKRCAAHTRTRQSRGAPHEQSVCSPHQAKPRCPARAKRCAAHTRTRRSRGAPHEQAMCSPHPHQAKPRCPARAKRCAAHTRTRRSRGANATPSKQSHKPRHATSPPREEWRGAFSTAGDHVGAAGAHAEVGGDRPEFTSGRSGGWDSPPKGNIAEKTPGTFVPRVFEARTRFELACDGFANRCLTTWLPRRLSARNLARSSHTIKIS